MSYVRLDDQHDDGQLTQFRERLSAEVRVQTGHEFLIFQDRNDIAWGQAWQERIDEALDAVTLLIVIITPSFFLSPACRKEVERFLERERKLGRQDLILPIYYVSSPKMDDATEHDADDLAQVLASRQYADWRELRFEPFTSPAVRKTLAQLASRMRDTFWRPTTDTSSSSNEPLPAATTRSQSPQSSRVSEITTKTEPPTHVVDPYQRGDFVTVGAAIAAASPGDRILVRPGLYQEGLVIDKPLEIIGEGPVKDIEIQARAADAVLFKANIGRVANLTLSQAGGEGKWNAVDITQGRLELEGCDISSQSEAAVMIRNGADPRLRRNVIHDSERGGVLVFGEGLGTLEDNDIFGGSYASVAIWEGGNPTLRRNVMHEGVVVANRGLGTLEDNDISSNDDDSAVEIKTGGNPVFRRNKIHGSKGPGVLVYGRGLGTLEDNDIFANDGAGVEVTTSGKPTLRGNRISNNKFEAVWVHSRGRGVFEDNDLTGNGRGPWDIEEDSENLVTRARNREQDLERGNAGGDGG